MEGGSQSQFGDIEYIGIANEGRLRRADKSVTETSSKVGRSRNRIYRDANKSMDQTLMRSRK
jgi:hypothetical protein